MLGIWQMNMIGPRMILLTLISALSSNLHAEQVSQDQEPRELKSKAWLFLSLLKASGSLLFVKNIIHYAYH